MYATGYPTAPVVTFSVIQLSLADAVHVPLPLTTIAPPPPPVPKFLVTGVIEMFVFAAVGGFGAFCTAKARLVTFTVLLVTATPFRRNSSLWFPVVCGCQSQLAFPAVENSTAPFSHIAASAPLPTWNGGYPTTA